MTKNFTTLLTTSLIASAFTFSGCGDETQSINNTSANQAHQVTIKKPRADANLPDADIWHNYVDISSIYDANKKKMQINVHCNKGVSSDVLTYQVYIDSDQNSQTGFSAGESSWAISGADYLIDDDALYKSTSDTEWTWEWVRDISVIEYGDETKDYNRVFSLGSDTIQDIFGDNPPAKINISIEPVDINWEDTNNYVSIQSVDISDGTIKLTKDELVTMIQNGEDVTQVDVSGIRDMYLLFYNNKDFNQDISGWDVSNVTDMRRMFQGAETFNQAIGSWNVSSVKNMSGMFHGAKTFNQPLGDWNVSQVIAMSKMFKQTAIFNQDISAWDVSNVTGMYSMFKQTVNFNQDISAWDVSNVTGMGHMFYSAQSFNQDISSWNVSQVSKHIDFSPNSPLEESHKPHFVQ